MNDLDRRLTEAGERWREQQPPPCEVDGSIFAPRRRRWFRLDPAVVGLTGAAAAIVAILVGVFAIGINSGSNNSADNGAANANAAAAPADRPQPLENGQLVTATGTADGAGGELRLCPPVSRTSAQSQAPSSEPACPGAVRLRGDIGVVARFAGAPITVVGRWQDGAIVVTETNEPLADAQGQLRKPAGCAVPAGGNLAQQQAVVRAHPKAYSWAWRTDDGSVTVGVTGSLAHARTELGANVCVIRAPHSYAQLTRAQRSVAQSAAALDIYDYGIEVVDNVAVVAVLVPFVTAEVQAFADRLGDVVQPVPWITPVR